MSFQYVREMPGVRDILNTIPLPDALKTIKEIRDKEIMSVFKGESFFARKTKIGDKHMSLFSVDKDKCKGDGLCVSVCPIGRIIRMDEKTRLPVLIEGGESACINCGHCVAVCPHGAFSLATMPVESCQSLPEEWNLSPQQIEYFLKGRRSTRVYKKEPVKREILEKLVDIARYAPSGINRQPIRWIIVHQEKEVVRLAQTVVEWMRSLIKEKAALAESFHMESMICAWEKGKDPICRNAPHLVIATGLKDDPIVSQASAIALTYLELSAAAFGLGACWAGYAQMAINMYEPAQKVVGISRRSNCFGAMLIGYPGFKYSRIPLRNKAPLIWR